ncbi:MAG: hypothetical protein LBG19_04380 [Prevotellaceae bacterium]|jgi:hypothetical protein|nr:hypothetical protein [Prevotellaceae bacterium]
MIGFAIYAEALLKSWYNSNYHPHWIFEKHSFKLTRSRTGLKATNSFNEDAKRSLNRLAINIKRSISSIIFTKEKNLFAQQQDTAYFQHQSMLLLKGAINETKRAISKGDERARCLWIFGIGIAVVTCLISVCVSTCLSDNTDEKIKELRDTIQQDAATNKTLIENNASMIKSALSNDSTLLNMIENKNRSSKQQRAK